MNNATEEQLNNYLDMLQKLRDGKAITEHEYKRIRYRIVQERNKFHLSM